MRPEHQDNYRRPREKRWLALHISYQKWKTRHFPSNDSNFVRDRKAKIKGKLKKKWENKIKPLRFRGLSNRATKGFARFHCFPFLIVISSFKERIGQVVYSFFLSILSSQGKAAEPTPKGRGHVWDFRLSLVCAEIYKHLVSCLRAL